MKMKLYFLGVFTLVTLAISAPRTWTFKSGKTVEGEYFSSGTSTVVIKKNGTNYFLNISDLSTNDQAYVAKMQFTQRQARLDAETNQMAQAGMIEFTPQLIENFPEKVNGRHGWMDAEYHYLQNAYVPNQDLQLGFEVRANGEDFSKCIVPKLLYGSNYPSDLSDTQPNPLEAVVTNLKEGDKVRLIGECRPQDPMADNPDYLFIVQKVEVIETAAEKAAREEAADNQSDLSQ
jgi:hypothetical protein